MNSSTTISSVASQPLHPDACKSCLWSRIQFCQCSPTSWGALRRAGKASPTSSPSCAYLLLLLHPFLPDNKGSCSSSSGMCNVRMHLRKATKKQVVWLQACSASWFNHRPGMHSFGMGEILVLNSPLLIHRSTTCATYAHVHICSKHLHTRNSYNNIFGTMKKYIKDLSHDPTHPHNIALRFFGPVLKAAMPGHHYTNTDMVSLLVLAKYLTMFW